MSRPWSFQFTEQVAVTRMEEFRWPSGADYDALDAYRGVQIKAQASLIRAPADFGGPTILIVGLCECEMALRPRALDALQKLLPLVEARYHGYAQAEVDGNLGKFDLTPVKNSGNAIEVTLSRPCHFAFPLEPVQIPAFAENHRPLLDAVPRSTRRVPFQVASGITH